MNRQMHVIRRQSLELELAPGQDPHQLQEQIKGIFTSQVVPILDAVMSRQVAESELLRIDRLELDLGTLDPERLKEQLPECLRRHFEQALAAEIGRATTPDPGEMDITIRQQTDQPLLLDLEQSELQLLIHYLCTGLLPWWNPEEPAFDLEGILSHQLEQQPKPLLQAMRRLPSGRVAARLSRQLNPSLLERLTLALAEKEGSGSAKLLEQVIVSIAERPELLSTKIQKAVFEQLLHQLLQPTPSAAWLTPIIQRLVNEHGLDAVLLYERLALLADQGHPINRRIVQWLKEQIDRPVRNVAERDNFPPTEHTSSVSTDQQKMSNSGQAKSDSTAATPAGLPKGAAPSGSPAEIKEKSIIDSPTDAGTAEAISSFTESAPHKSALPAVDTKIAPNSEITQGSKPAAYDKEEAESLIELEQGLYLNNAGLVLLWSYLPRFFRTIGLVDAKDFINGEARERGLLMLQYLVSGKTEFQEHELLLNKLFCGWPLPEPVTCKLDIRDHERAEVDTLLDAVIENWKSLRKTSRNGLREAFLQREGRLSRDEMGWQLKVNRVGVDVLLESLPWGIGLIRLPWMKDTIRVEW